MKMKSCVEDHNVTIFLLSPIFLIFFIYLSYLTLSSIQTMRVRALSREKSLLGERGGGEKKKLKIIVELKNIILLMISGCIALFRCVMLSGIKF